MRKIWQVLEPDQCDFGRQLHSLGMSTFGANLSSYDISYRNSRPLLVSLALRRRAIAGFTESIVHVPFDHAADLWAAT
jgi:hypothetical protein